AIARELDAVLRKIEKALPQPLMIARQREADVFASKAQYVVLRARGRSERAFDLGEEFGHVDRLGRELQVARINARVIEHIVDEAAQLAGAGEDAARVFSH